MIGGIWAIVIAFLGARIFGKRSLTKNSDLAKSDFGPQSALDRLWSTLSHLS